MSTDEKNTLPVEMPKASATAGVMRPEVAWFAERMEKVLAENDHKGGWSNCGIPYLWAHLISEKDELREAIKKRNEIDPEEIIKECIDVANYCMMIADQVS